MCRLFKKRAAFYRYSITDEDFIENGGDCTNNTDDNLNFLVNDGCPAIGAPESGTAAGAPCDDRETICTGGVDNDADGRVNDGCDPFPAPINAQAVAESGSQCNNVQDDDSDGIINDGCPPESGAQCDNSLDDDSDGIVNDGCPETGAACSAGNVTDDDLDGRVNDGCPIIGNDNDGDGKINDGCYTTDPMDPSIGSPNVDWIPRKYSVITLASANALRGRLMNNASASGTGQCLRADTQLGVLSMGACSGAPEWEVTTRNEIKLGTQCVVRSSAISNTYRLGSCGILANAERRTLVLTSNGQIRTVGLPVINGAPGGAQCLSGSGSSVVSVTCQRKPDPNAAVREAIPAQDWTLLLSSPQLVSTQFGDSSEIDSARSYYRTLSIHNGQVCVRTAQGPGCASYSGGGLLPWAPFSPVPPPEYTDTAGWAADETGSTVQFGKLSSTWPLQVCGRGYYGMVCGRGGTTNSSLWTNGPFSTGQGWAASVAEYGSIRLADVDGDGLSDVCGKYGSTTSCGLSTGTSFATPTAMSVEDGLIYGGQISYGDIDGDGREEPCGRQPLGMFCMYSEGDAFRDVHLWSTYVGNNSGESTADFGDNDPVVPVGYSWGSTGAKSLSIQLVDINRDGMSDVCGRGTYGIHCALSTGTAFERKRNVMPFDFTDSAGWNTEPYGSTLRFGNLDGDGRMDYCARGVQGMWCGEGP